MTRTATLVIFERAPDVPRFYVIDPDSDHLNFAIAAAGDAPSIEAVDAFVKLVDHDQLTEIDTDQSGIISGNFGPYDVFDRVILVTAYDG